jgi:hypothetical protein
MNRIKKILVGSLGAAAATMGLSLVSTVPAQATTDQPSCTYVDTNGNCVQLTTTVGVTTFDVDEHFKDKAHIYMVGKGDVYLTVQVKPMTPKQIGGKCRTAPVGTPFWNEMVDPTTGKHYYAPWHVKAGDNVFCQDHHGVWRKKSCGNRAKGLFGTPPPPKAARVTGKVQIVDFATWKARLKLVATKHLSGGILVMSKDGTCVASATLDNDVRAAVWEKAKFKSRSYANAVSVGSARVTQKASTDTKLQGRLKAAIDIVINAKLSAMCSTVPPQHFGLPSLKLTPEACVAIGQTTGVVDYVAGNGDSVAHNGTVSISAKDVQSQPVAIPAMSSVGGKFSNLAPGSFTVTLTLDNGQSVSESTTIAQCEVQQPENPSVAINQKNQIPAGDTATVCADFNVPGTDTASLKFTSDLGAFPAGSTFPVSGMGNKCTTVQAPDDADKPATFIVTASIRDDQTGLSDTTPEDNSTVIKITYDTPPL